MSTTSIGRRGEDLALRYLEKLDYILLARNYRDGSREIDLVLGDGDTIVFVEVKARRDAGSYGHPKYAVTRTKQQKISKVALYYLKGTGQIGCRARFDVVAIISRDGDLRCEVIKNAFELAYR